MLVLFLGLKFGQILFFWDGKFFSYFSGICTISAIFLGLTNFQLFLWVFQFLCHTLESFAWRTHSIEKRKIIVAFHIYSNFDKHCILSHSIFLGLNFGAFYFFGVWIWSHSTFSGSWNLFSDEHPCQRNACVPPPPRVKLATGACSSRADKWYVYDQNF